MNITYPGIMCPEALAARLELERQHHKWRISARGTHEQHVRLAEIVSLWHWRLPVEGNTGMKLPTWYADGVMLPHEPCVSDEHMATELSNTVENALWLDLNAKSDGRFTADILKELQSILRGTGLVAWLLRRPQFDYAQMTGDTTKHELEEIYRLRSQSGGTANSGGTIEHFSRLPWEREWDGVSDLLEAAEYLVTLCVECSEGRMTDAEALTRASVRAQAAIRAAKEANT